MELKAVPDLEPPSKDGGILSSQIESLTDLVDQALAGDYVGDADGLAKLVGALAKLIDAQTKAEQSVSKADLQRFVLGMAESINAHVAAPETRSLIQRDWRRVMVEVAG